MVSRPDDAPENPDVLALQRVYPDAAALFQPLLPLREAQNTALYVLDTNALLIPYATSAESASKISTTYERLARERRLIVPGQVAREFARNRAQKLVEVYQQLSRRSNLSVPQSGRHPLLDSLPGFHDITALEKELEKKINAYRDAVAKTLETIRNWHWDDPISSLYAKIFTSDVVFDPALDEKAVAIELETRTLRKQPPGYKDASKSDRGVGDLLIWLSILKLATERKAHVIFVSGDEKTDWRYQSEGQALYPRYELVDEFRRATGGKSFHICKFSEVLEMYGVGKPVIDEVKQEEKQQATAPSRPILYGVDSQTFGGIVEQGVMRWLRAAYEAPVNASKDPKSPFDLTIGDPPVIGVDVMAFPGAVFTFATSTRFLQAVRRMNFDLAATGLQKGIVFVVFEASAAADRFTRLHPEAESQNVKIFVGHLSETGELIVSAQASQA